MILFSSLHFMAPTVMVQEPWESCLCATCHGTDVPPKTIYYHIEMNMGCRLAKNSRAG
jgi:hypothetical protein